METMRKILQEKKVEYKICFIKVSLAGLYGNPQSDDIRRG